jgi:hypothetical protein
MGSNILDPELQALQALMDTSQDNGKNLIFPILLSISHFFFNIVDAIEQPQTLAQPNMKNKKRPCVEEGR